LYVPFFTDAFDKHFKKLVKKDNQLKQQILAKIEEMKKEPSPQPIKYLYDLKGKWKMRIGHYRLLYAYCKDCRKEGFERLNHCVDCNSKNDDSIVYFDVIHRGNGYDDL
jgi:mRNA-degrading endonuclease RelE of RelBE toxin-antitoxin system